MVLLAARPPIARTALDLAVVAKRTFGKTATVSRIAYSLRAVVAAKPNPGAMDILVAEEALAGAAPARRDR